jgi:endo-1,4-beta-D-glucanase Y
MGLLATILIVAIAAVVWNRSSKDKTPPTPSTSKISLERLWQQYKTRYWEESSGRTRDTERDSATTSEGQSYTMLRAVWMDDRAVFDKTWQWTVQNLQRSDKLFSWLWGAQKDGSYGIKTDSGGQNSASDGDSDIALALLMAAQKWRVSEYRDNARDIVRAIWDHEVAIIQDKPYLTTNNIEKTSSSPTALINPSYLAPYAYRIFGEVDKDHDWDDLTNNSYELIRKASQARLNTDKSVGLPPNWLVIDKSTGELSASDDPKLDTDFGFDAFRTVWRVALDWHWYQKPEARETLEGFSFLADEWKRQGKLTAVYSHDGHPKADYTKPALYGGTLGYFQFIEPSMAKSIYDSQFVANYDGTVGWKQPLSYYDDNWAWFGIGLYQQQLPNIAEIGVEQ